jgi:hypothetical protein
MAQRWLNGRTTAAVTVEDLAQVHLVELDLLCIVQCKHCLGVAGIVSLMCLMMLFMLLRGRLLDASVRAQLCNTADTVVTGIHAYCNVR